MQLLLFNCEDKKTNRLSLLKHYPDFEFFRLGFSILIDGHAFIFSPKAIM